MARDPRRPLRPVRAYRNRLVDGRVVFEVYLDFRDAQNRLVAQTLLYPRLGKVDSYLDWRVASAAVQSPSPDFDEPALIALDAWEKVVEYVERAWQENLLPDKRSDGAGS